ncbi:aldo-keto reductase family 1 member B1-like [Leptopilina boulardi]|uniref:aldo-keto reductase family 1 member B1-like n=1 Tax=Leptopilina boulardi TaxID=63433 RepID=UPI0021F62862|nr:aldo-keto reductase family 1 member B1-like [Leptopilina boulardi]
MSSSNVPFLEFYNGYKMPILGLGTYMSKEGEVLEAVKFAIENGYRHIDTAFVYENEKEVGEAIREKIKDGTVKREDIFVTTKLANVFHKENLVVPACKKSLENLGLNYVDLYLVHWPIAQKEGEELNPKDADGNVILSDVDYLETWKGMEECSRLGLARSIGVSNFNSEQITRLMENSTIKPVNNQVEVNINLNQKKLIEFCKTKNITITAYSPLGRPGNRHGIKNSLDNPKLLEISKKYHKTPEQIAFRFLLQEGVAPIPKSVTKSRIKENFDIFDFELTKEEMSVIESIGTEERVCGYLEAKNSKYYPFNIPF